jgi:hypothetical protein
MGRQLTVEQLERKLDIAKRRRAAKEADRVANPKPYKPRPEQTLLYYRSVYDNDVYFRVYVNSETLALFTSPTEVGLLATLPSGATALSVRGSGTKPSMLKWYFGDATPQVIATAWGSRYIKNYDPKNGQSHRSIPFSVSTGAFALDDLLTKFNGLFGATGSKLALLGDRGQAELIPERMPIRS